MFRSTRPNFSAIAGCRAASITTPASAWLLAAGLATAGCKRFADPEHCANRSGDATCRDIWGIDDLSCSTCEHRWNGCVPYTVSEVCYSPMGAGESSDSGSGSSSSGPSGVGSSSGSGEGSSGASMMACENGSNCDAGAPYCVDNVCTDCLAAGSDEFCTALDASPAAPQCAQDWGNCVECRDDNSPACASQGLFCATDFTCKGCSTHAQCPESACNMYSGQCMPPNVPTYWVDTDQCDDAGPGDEASPLCSPSEALERAQGSVHAVIKLASGSYRGTHSFPDCISPTSTVAILGQGAAATLFGDPGAPALEVRCGARVFLDRVVLAGGAGREALSLRATSSVWLDHVTISESNPGLAAENGWVVARNSRFHQNAGAALELIDSVAYLENSIVSQTDGVGLTVSGGTINLRFATVVEGRGSSPSMFCDREASGQVHSSILASPKADTFDCGAVAFDHNLVTDIAMAEVDGNRALAYSPQWFANAPSGDYRLAPGAEPLAETGRWVLGDPWRDIHDTALPLRPGAAVWPGADQLD